VRYFPRRACGCTHFSRDVKVRLRIDIDVLSELSSFKREDARWLVSLSDFSATCTEQASERASNVSIGSRFADDRVIDEVSGIEILS